jgi:hypothetical protein
MIQRRTCSPTKWVHLLLKDSHLDNLQHDFNVRSKPELLTAIQRTTLKGHGLSVRSLKESWKEAPQAIEELEKEGEVYVTRTVKDGQLRMVFYNEVKGDDEGPIEVEKGQRDFLNAFRLTQRPLRRVSGCVAWPCCTKRY